MTSKHILLILLLLLGNATIGQIIYMVPDGTSDSLPRFREVTRSDKDYPRINERYSRSPFLEMAEIYRYAQCYARNAGRGGDPRPVYLALTNHQGGFPMRGFALATPGGKDSLMPETDYIDLHINTLKEDPRRCGGYTLCHELGHVVLGKLSGTYVSHASSIHYFSIVTEYTTAFNEGFGEHLENTSLMMERDTAVRNAAMADYRATWSRIAHACNGYERDYRWPFRMDLYRASSLFWFQKLEDYKRNRFAEDHLAKYSSREIRTGDPWEDIRYRNTAVTYDPSRLRTAVQAASTEGVVAGFLTDLVKSSAEHPSADSAFFALFSISPGEAARLSPVTHAYLKIMHVLAKYVRMDDPGTAPVVAFINGYGREFPAERETVLRLWEENSGHPFSPALPKEEWVLVKGARHSPIAIIQYGVTVPEYTFNIHAADPLDIATLRGEPFSAHLLGNGPEESEEGRLDLSIPRILLLSVGHILLIAAGWLAVALAATWILSAIAGVRFGWKRALSLSGIFLVLLLGGIAGTALFPVPAVPVLIVAGSVLGLMWLVRRKGGRRTAVFLASGVLMTAMILYSVW